MDPTTAVIAAALTLALFAAVGVRAGRTGARDRDAYLAARATQRSGALALSFFASGAGAWVLFAPPEVGVLAGGLGALGYGLAAAAPFAVLAWLGPRIRARVPAGVTLTDFVRLRFGRPVQAYTAVVSVAYMFIFVTAELTAIGGVLALLAGVDPWIPIVAVAAVTAGYTAYGGLPASLRTDRWQAWLVLGLAAAAVVVVSIDDGAPLSHARAGGLFEPTVGGLEALVVLVIAVTAANLFHQGYWQRSWAATDDRQLARGALGAALLSVPVVALLAALGTVAAGAGVVEVPSLAFFSLLTDLPAAVVLLVVVLAVALVCSSTDTLQNGLVALVSQDVADGRLRLGAARLVTIALTVPAVVIAVQGHSVLRLFLVADLLAAATVVPVLLGLWRRATAGGALAGAVAGLLAVVAVGWAGTGSVAGGLRLLTLPDGLDLGAFVAAPVASTVVSLAAGVRRSRRSAEPADPVAAT